jgi:hypothetical protein
MRPARGVMTTNAISLETVSTNEIKLDRYEFRKTS